MKEFLGGLAISLGVLSSSVAADVFLEVNGTAYSLTALMENCQSMADDPAAQVACFQAVSVLLEEQTTETPSGVTVSAPEALDSLRAVAEYEDAESGLIIQGAECDVHILYYANYFHVSRRNVSSIDLFSAQFDVSEIAYDQMAQGDGFIAKGVMQAGATAATIGGEAISSAEYNFSPRSARQTVGEYAVGVVEQLTAVESREFDFVLVHPAKQESSADIWNAFAAYTAACQA